jgi:signal transduction histidine kinase
VKTSPPPAPTTPASSGSSSQLGPSPPEPLASSDLNLKILAHLLRYIRDYFGSTAIERIRRESGLRDLEESNRWVSLQQFEAILHTARDMMRDDDEFLAACAYQLANVGGPVRFLIGAISPMDAYVLASKNFRLISSISAPEPERRGYGRMFMRYRTTRPESRLMCLSRQAQLIMLPTLWGLPRAHLVEDSCVARGDSTCDYLIRVQESRRWLPTLLGGALGGAGAAALSAAGALHVSTLWATPLLGVLGGAIIMLNRHAKANRAIADDINEAYLDAAREDVRARQALFDLAMRTQHWTHLMEQQVAGRATTMQKVSAALGQLRGETDAESPISVLREAVSALALRTEALDPSGQSAVLELEDNVSKLDAALGNLHRLATNGTQIVALNPRWLDTEPLPTDLRTRLQAITLRKDVRTSVFAVREAPARVRIDVPLFNRITDALLANAARSTERGSIIVEIGGTPGTLAIKVSDTGTGMSPEDVQTILCSEPPAVTETTDRSWASGMWVVARMLAAIGGRLEVKSTPGEGTTFWAHYPIETNAPDTRTSSPPPTERPQPTLESTVSDKPDPMRKVN